MWVVVKIMVLFGSPVKNKHPKGDHSFDKYPYVKAHEGSMKAT